MTEKPKKPIKTLDIEIALMAHLNIRQNLIVPNISWGMNLHECDLLSLSAAGYATEIEIKVSKYDLLKDCEKRHNHESNLIKRFYFAVPEHLTDIALTTIPERAGLYIVKWAIYGGGGWEQWRRKVELVKKCEDKKHAVKWDDKKRYELARLGAIRILGLKRKIRKLQNDNSITKRPKM